MHHLVALIDGDEMLKRASVAELVEALRALADNATRAFELREAKPNGLLCSECGEPQFTTMSGDTCVGGHGGAEGVFDLAPATAAIEEPPPLPESETPPPLPPDAFAEIAEPPRPAIEWTDEQKAALDTVSEWRGSGSESWELDLWERAERNRSPFFALTGPAGSGKTTLMREIIDRYPGAALTAMTGKAALRLAQLTGRGASTLHKVLYFPPKPGEEVRFTRLREPPASLVCVDESSMMTPAVFADLKRWGVSQVLLVGDSFQLPPVITGKELQQHGEDFSVFAEVKGAELTAVMRNAGGVLRAATHVRERGDICRQSYSDGEGVGYEYVEHRAPLEAAVDAYCEDRDEHFLITWRNATRMRANRLIRQRFGHEGPLPDAGEPVLLRRNGQGFLNGEVVDCAGFDAGPTIDNVRTLWLHTTGGARILVSFEGGEEEKGGEFFDGQMPWIRSWTGYHIELTKKSLPEPIPATWGYVLTAHCAQGSQCRRATVFLERGDLRSSHFRRMTTLPSGEQASTMARWVYTATTRSTKRTTMIVER